MPARVPAKATLVRKLILSVVIFLALVGKPLYLFLSAIPSSIVWLLIGVKKIFSPKYPLYFKTTSAKRKNHTGKIKRFTAKHTIVFLIFSGFVVIFFFWARFIFTLPKIDQLQTKLPLLTTKIYDRNGNLLYKIYRSENRTLLPINQIPQNARLATISIEDAEFYNHHGFSVRGILRALERNLTRGEVSGGSTITQQLIKNTLLSPEKTFNRKIKEVILAILVDMRFSKDQILEMYLNQVSYGGTAQGIEEASQLYFAKSAKDLDLAESALLAGLPRSPTTYSPFGANPDMARQRQLEVLSRMTQEGYISREQATTAANKELKFSPQRNDIKAPHFVMYVRQLLVEKYGEEMVAEGGLSIYTSLDLPLQEITQKAVEEEMQKVQKLRINNGAALVTNPKTGEILAMVGSKDYFNDEIDGNFNITTALRQPGSSIKPVNYSYALESKKYTAASIISDTPVTYSAGNSVPYAPRNYDNKYHGNVSLRVALASSLNIPAVKVLSSYGVNHMLDQGQKLGITTWADPSRYGLSITLGGAEVKMTDMAVVYGTFANSGKKVGLYPILKVVDAKGNVLENNPCKQSSPTAITSTISLIRPAHAEEVTPSLSCSQQVLDPGVAYILTSILSDNKARTLAFGPRSLLVVDNHPEVAVKTGTTQNLRDNWTIGFTNDYVVSVWVGNNDNSPMAYVASGITGATPIWHNIFTNLLKDKPATPWQIPTGVIAINNCGASEYFLEGTQKTIACTPPPAAKENEDKILTGATTEQQ
ncbi:MAG: PBP1A family penicillin-binding protein [Candidatus Blackburnbacteria bacterium]|nr:PBP1A family penicillin-binding protein [Candidatus Blackburnbacteria bacterium]